MASLEMLNEGPEKSGLIRFSAYAPFKPEHHAIKFRQDGKHIQLEVCSCPSGDSLVGFSDFLVVDIMEMRKVAYMLLKTLLPDSTFDLSDILLLNQVRK